MIAVIDTSSLISIVRYYLPFDTDGVLYSTIEKLIQNQQLVVLDKVVDESRYVAKGITYDSLNVLHDKKNILATTSTVLEPKLLKGLNNEFMTKVGHDMKALAFEIEKSKFLKTADPYLINYCLKNACTLITEESRTSNDKKSFKKLPLICDLLDINQITITKYLQFETTIDLKFYKRM